MEFPSIGRKGILLAALFLSFVGLLALHLWPESQMYSKASVSQAKISQDGKWVEIHGSVDELEQKGSGTSLSLCGEFSTCIPVWLPKKAKIDYALVSGDSVIVRGEISTISRTWGKHIRAHSITHSVE